MMARGNRSMGPQEGAVFFVGNKRDEEYQLEKLLSMKGQDLMDGAKNLQILAELATVTKASTMNSIVKQTSGKWISNTEELANSLELKTVKEKVM